MSNENVFRKVTKFLRKYIVPVRKTAEDEYWNISEEVGIFDFIMTDI